VSGPGGVMAPPPLRPFTRCASPLSLANLTDGTHEFAVRAAGYTLADVRAWTVDARPPIAVITGSTLPSPGAPRAASFSFGLAAAAPPEPGGAAFLCRLARTAPPPGRPADPVPLVSGGGPVGAWASCTSPLHYQALGPGSWAFAVRAVDGAGNGQAAQPATAGWAVALPRVAALAAAGVGGGDVGPNNTTASAGGKGTASFAFTAAGGDGPGAGESFLCQLSVWGAAAGSEEVRTFTPTAPPAPCTSPATFTGLAKGLYRFTVALVGDEGGVEPGGGNATAALTWPAGALALAAVADVSVLDDDTLTPTLSAAPPTFLAASSLPAIFEWGLDGGGSSALPPGAAFACLLQGPPAAGLPGDFTGPCTSPLAFPALPDGSYAFRVAVQGPDGSQGPSASASFVVDGAGPALEGVRWWVVEEASGRTARALGTLPGTLCSISAPAPAVLRAAPSASDGVLGSGVAALYCRVLEDEGSGAGSSVAGGRAGAGGGGAATQGIPGAGRRALSPSSTLATAAPAWEPCTAGFNVTLASPGNHALEVMAVDAAGNEGGGVRCGVALTGDGSGVVAQTGRAAALVAGVVAGVGILASFGLLAACV